MARKAAPKTPRTPRVKKGAGKKAATPEAEEGGEVQMEPSPTKGRKRGAKGEGEKEGRAKKVKAEPATPESEYFSAGQVEQEVEQEV